MGKTDEILGAKIHPMAAEFPLLEGDEFEQLVESIDKHGIQTPILVLHNPRLAKHEPLIVVDGRNRLRAWERLVQQGKQDRDGWQEYVEVLADHGDPNDEGYIRRSILAANIHRRHLTPDQRVAIMLRLTGEQIIKQAAEAKAASTAKARAAKSVDQKSGPQEKRDVKQKHANSAAGQLAATANVGRHVAATAIKVAKAEQAGTLPPGTMKAVEDGKTTLAKAKKQAELTAKTSKPKKKSKTEKRASIDKDTFRLIAAEWLHSDRESFREELDVWRVRAFG
jgi:ParB-like chromosome segregation protein Spo0J